MELPPPDIKDIADVLLENPSIPENKRYCGNPECNQPVGRGRDGEPGRTEGFCRKCRHPFSFTPKLAPQTSSVGSTRWWAASPTVGSAGSTSPATRRSAAWVVLKGLLSNDERRRDPRPSSGSSPRSTTRTSSRSTTSSSTTVSPTSSWSTSAARRSARRSSSGRPRTTANPTRCRRRHAITFMLEVLPAFGYLHRQGLLYCDFKPDNVIRTESSLKLIDLGAVYRMDDTTSAIYGTPGYQAPEIGDTGPTHPVRPLHRRADARGALHRRARLPDAPTPSRSPPPTTCRCSRSTTRSTASSCAPPRPTPTTASSPPTRWPMQLDGVLREIVGGESGMPWPEVSALVHERAAQRLRGSRRLARAAGAARRRRRPRRRLPRLARGGGHRTRRDPRAPRARTRAHGRGAAARGAHAHRGRAARRRRHACSTRSRSPTRGSGASRGRPAAMRSRRPTPTAPWPSSAACTRRCRASWRRSSRWPTPPRAAATWRTPRTGTTSCRDRSGVHHRRLRAGALSDRAR